MDKEWQQLLQIYVGMSASQSFREQHNLPCCLYLFYAEVATLIFDHWVLLCLLVFISIKYVSFRSPLFISLLWNSSAVMSGTFWQSQ